MASMMDEMQKTLARRRAKVDAPQKGDDVSQYLTSVWGSFINDVTVCWSLGKGQKLRKNLTIQIFDSALVTQGKTH